MKNTEEGKQDQTQTRIRGYTSDMVGSAGCSSIHDGKEEMSGKFIILGVKGETENSLVF